MKNAEIPKNDALKIPSLELNNCEASWSKDPVGGESALKITPVTPMFKVRFHTVADTIWFRAVKGKEKLNIVWGSKSENPSFGDKWESFKLGRQKLGQEWIVTVEFKEGQSFYLYPFAVLGVVA